MSDPIDREYAIKRFCEDGTYLERHGVQMMTLCEAKQRAVDLIESFPSAQPSKTGKWITVHGRLGNEVECDKCHSVFWYWMGNYRFCPSCGADMRGESND